MNLEPARGRRLVLSVLNMMTPPRPTSTYHSLPAGCSPQPRRQAAPGVVRLLRTPTRNVYVGWPARRRLRNPQRPQRRYAADTHLRTTTLGTRSAASSLTAINL